MFRNIVYDGRKSLINLFTWNDDGDRVHQTYDFKPYLYINKDDGSDGISIYNEPLQKLYFKSKKEREKFANGYGNVYYNLAPEQQFLIEKYLGLNKSDDFNKNPLKIFYLDIEVHSPNCFPDPHQANAPINLITIYDSLTSIYHTFGTKPYHGSLTSRNLIYHYHEDEFEMLRAFVRFWRKDFPDIVVGWYSDSFDIPYIINRINKLYKENKVYKDQNASDRLSPLDYCFCLENVERRLENYEKLWHIQGITLFDYMYLYKVFTRDKRESYSLNHIAETELNVGKNSVNKVSLSQLADQNWDQFVEYNVQDVRLIKQLEDKLRYIEICKKIGYLSLCPFKKSESTVSVVTGIIAQKALEENKIISTFKNVDDRPFEGGFVRDSQVGLQRDILYFDVNSLYPNTIVTLNLSPETKLGSIERIDDKIKIKTKTNKEILVDKDKFEKYIKDKEISVSEADVLFSQKKKGLVPSIIEEIYSERVNIKNNAKLLNDKKVKLSNLLKNDNSNEDLELISKIRDIEFKISQDDILQYVIKILLNKIYGYFAEKSSPFYDLEIAKSVTHTGQGCIKEAANIVLNHIKNTYKLDYDAIVFGDTDSVGITINPILVSNNIPLEVNNKINPDVFNIANDFKKIIDLNINSWAKTKLNSKWTNYEFKLESISSSAIFVKKKNYVLEMICDENGNSFYDDKGKKLKRKYKYTGLEVVKTSTPKKLKPLLKKIVEIIMSEQDKTKVYNQIKKIYDSYEKFVIEDIAVPVSLNNYDKYAEKANGFRIGKGTPIHVKSAIYYNNVLKKYNLTNKYETLKSGDKIKFVLLEKNKLDIKTIAFLYDFPKELNFLKIDKSAMFEKTILKPLDRIFKVLKWNIMSPTSEEKNNLLEMFSD